MPVDVIVPPDKGDCAVIDVTVPPFALRFATCCAVALDDTPFCTTISCAVPLKEVKTGRLVTVMLLMSVAQFAVSECSHKAVRPER